MLLITSLVASIAAIIFVHLSFNVIKLRRKNQVRMGNGGVEELERAIRAHANFKALWLQFNGTRAAYLFV